MKLILDRSREMVLWAADRIAEVKAAGGFANGTRGIGIADSDGNILAVACFHSWEPWYGTMEVSIAAADPRWMRARKCIAEIFDYVFTTTNTQRLWSRTPSRNTRALRALKGLGFTYEAVLKRQFGDDDAVISYRFREP